MEFTPVAMPFMANICIDKPKTSEQTTQQTRTPCTSVSSTTDGDTLSSRPSEDGNDELNKLIILSSIL